MGRNDIAVLELHRGIVTRDRGITIHREGSHLLHLAIAMYRDDRMASRCTAMEQ